jgi:hypothetical protein
MSDTIKNQGIQVLSQDLTSFEQSVVLAASEPRLKSLEKVEISKKITNVISRANMTLGANSAKPGLTPKQIEDERMALEKLIYEDLKLSFPNSTLKEFEIAVYKGSMGEFKKRPDEILFISPEKIHSWMKSYILDIKRDTIAKQRAYEAGLDKAQHLSPEVIKEREKGFLMYCVIPPWKNYKTVGVPVSDPVNAIYDALDKIGLIPFTKERKAEILKEAEDKFKEQARSVSSLSEVRDAKKILIKLEKGDKTVKSRIKCLAKQMALEIFLKDLIKDEVDLEQLIKEKL